MKKVFIDQLHRSVEIAFPPKQIISLVPSQTELLFDLGLDKDVIGITKFCVHPEKWFREKKRVGGTKTVDIDVVRSLAPDLIIANKEENDHLQIEMLSGKFPVWISDVRTLKDAIAMISTVGDMTGRSSQAEKIAEQINSEFSNLQKPYERTCAYLIWNDPMMTVNNDTFINDMLKRCGCKNVFGDNVNSRYPEITTEDLISASPEILLLASEPFPFSQKHIDHFQMILPRTTIRLADGEMFSWYGSRLKYAAQYFRSFVMA